MKIKLHSALLSAVLGLALLSASAHAAVLSVDFGPSPAQSGFQQQDSASATYTTSLGDITAATDGSFFNRGGTTFDLYDDFNFENNGTTGFNFTLSGAGILADTAYELKFWSYDSNTSDATVFYDGQNGSTGSLSISFVSSSKPTTLDQYSGTATFTSNASGVIDIAVTASDGAEGPRVNGFEVVPEPSSFALLAGMFGLAWVMLRRRS